MGKKSPEYCAKQGPVLSWSLRAVADTYFVLFFVLFCFSSKRAELLGEQKEVLALSVEVSALYAGKKTWICAGGETI